MPLLAFPAVFMRGGTSRAVMFHRRDLPERTAWDPIFLAAMGTPDPYGGQLNGMGWRRDPCRGNNQVRSGRSDGAVHFQRAATPGAAIDCLALHRGGGSDRGTLPFQALRPPPVGAVRIGMPSGILTVDAGVAGSAGVGWIAHSRAF